MKKFFTMLWNLVLPTWAFGFLLVLALVSFDIFNFTVTEYSLIDVLGNLKIFGILWATVLAFTFCTIDFVAIARLYPTDKSRTESVKKWFLHGAWFLASAMNSFLVWWGLFVKTQNLTISISLALLAWLIRVMLMSVFVVAGNKAFTVKPISLDLMFEK